jgi:hypothetical protein
MADPIEQRLADVEQILAHLPTDLDVRFAGADSRMNARFDRLSIQLQNMDRRLQQVEVGLATVRAMLDHILQRLPPAPGP